MTNIHTATTGAPSDADALADFERLRSLDRRLCGPPRTDHYTKARERLTARGLLPNNGATS